MSSKYNVKIFIVWKKKEFFYKDNLIKIYTISKLFKFIFFNDEFFIK